MSKTIKVLVNRPPDKPKICGPRIVELGMKYTYTIKGTDPDNDDLREFIVDWGDGYGYGLQGTFPSGTVKDFEHFWSENGTFTVKARVRDIYWVSSDWATIKVFVPRNKIVNNLWFDCFSDRFPILERFISWIVHL
jgi:hypothetical protein